MDSPSSGSATIRVIREFALSGMAIAFDVVIDEVTVGQATRKPRDIRVAAGKHQIYIRGGKSGFSNAIDIDLLAGSVMIFGCRGMPGISMALSSSAGWGGPAPKAINLHERSH
jgi:hypothetical protein